MRSQEFDVVHDRGNQHTKSSIEGSWEKSILVAHHAVKQRKDHITGKQQENQCLISTYDLDLNIHLIKDRSDTTVGERSRKQKISCLRIKIPRSSKKDRIQGLGQCSPTVAAEEELMKRVDVVEVVEVDLPRTVPRSVPRTSPSNRSPRSRRSSSKKDQRYDPSTGIHTSRSSNPAALRRPEMNATEKTRGRKP